MKKIIAIMALMVVCASVNVLAYTAVHNISALDRLSDLTTPGTSQKYQLGTVVNIYDSSKKAEKSFMYVKAGLALTAYRTYSVSVTSETAGEFKVYVATAPSTAASGPDNIVCIPQVAFTVNQYGFVQTKGDCTAYYISYSTVGVLGKIVSGATAALGITGESGTANTKETVYTIGISKAAGAASTTHNFYLFGKRAKIAN